MTTARERVMALRERPVLFSAPMVRAILAGKKTQTRRIVKAPSELGLDMVGIAARVFPGIAPAPIVIPDGTCPYGVPGDRLWVRETFIIETNMGSSTDYPPPFSDGRPVNHHRDDDWGEWWEQCHYRATDPRPELVRLDDKEMGWRPSIFMPRWASRITLEVTGVRIERLQDISEDDALAEGITQTHAVTPGDGLAVQNYAMLWDELNGKKAPWAENPWVWVVEFR